MTPHHARLRFLSRGWVLIVLLFLNACDQIDRDQQLVRMYPWELVANRSAWGNMIVARYRTLEECEAQSSKSKDEVFFCRYDLDAVEAQP